MIATTLIIVIPTVLLIYSFRYTCLRILRTQTSQDYASGLAAANGLNYPDVQGRLLQDAPAAELTALQKSLDADYVLLTYLLKHTAGLEDGGITVGQRMLMLDFKVMRLFCALSRRLAVPQARAALAEMSSILKHLANALGERIQRPLRP
jgi:hypothetical protein